MAEYTARDLRVARKWLADDSRQPITSRVAALLAWERTRALRGMARYARTEAKRQRGIGNMMTALRLDMVAAEASRRARGSK